MAAPPPDRQIRHLIFPWQMARWIFSTRDPIVENDDSITLINMGRFLVAVIFYNGVYLNRHVPLNQDPPTLWLFGPFIQAFVGLVGALAIMIVLALLARPGMRACTWRRMRHTRYAILGFFILVALNILAAGVFTLPQFASDPGEAFNVAAARTLLIGLAYPVAAWVVCVLACSLPIIPRNLFRAADSHPLLAPLLTGWWAVSGFFLNNLLPNFPDLGPRFSLVTSSVAAISAITLAIYEAHLYRTRYGVSVENGGKPQWYVPPKMRLRVAERITTLWRDVQRPIVLGSAWALCGIAVVFLLLIAQTYASFVLAASIGAPAPGLPAPTSRADVLQGVGYVGLNIGFLAIAAATLRYGRERGITRLTLTQIFTLKAFPRR